MGKLYYKILLIILLLLLITLLIGDSITRPTLVNIIGNVTLSIFFIVTVFYRIKNYDYEEK